VLMEGAPFVSEGRDVDGALADLVLTLREYAEDWDLGLGAAPNHAQHGALVGMVKRSSDAELTEWLKSGIDRA